MIPAAATGMGPATVCRSTTGMAVGALSSWTGAALLATGYRILGTVGCMGGGHGAPRDPEQRDAAGGAV